MLNRQIDQLFRRRKLRRRDRIGVAQHLACDPVLAVAAMVITTKHSKRQGVRARQDVEEWLLFDRIARQRADVSVWHEQGAILVKTNPTNAITTRLDNTAMAAGETLNCAVGLML